MTFRLFLLNSGAVLVLLLFPSLASAGNYSIGTGSVTYTDPTFASTWGTTGYVFDTQPPNATDPALVTVTGVTIAQTTNSNGLLIDNYDQSGGALAVTFNGAPSSITSSGEALVIYHTGPTETGDISLDTTGTTGGSLFSGGVDGVKVEADTGPVTNATVTLGADTINGVLGDGLRAYSGSGGVSVTTAATITGGNYGINATADTVLSVTVSGSVSGAQGSVYMDSLGQSSLTLQTGATLVGNAIGSSDGAGSALILQGHGTTANNFVNFNTMDVQDSGGGTWHLSGTSIFSGVVHILAGGDITIDGGELSGQTINQDIGAGGIHLNGGTVDPTAINIHGGTFGGTGTVIGNLNVTGGTVQVGASPDSLVVHGNYEQSGGIITFEIDPNGSGGFLESSLVLDPGSTVAINGTQIMFDFVGGVDPLAFFNTGEFNLDTFFKSSSGNLFSSDFNFDNVFGGDTFGIFAPGFNITNFAFDPNSGATALDETSVAGVPEPLTISFFGAGLAGAIAMRRRKKKTA